MKNLKEVYTGKMPSEERLQFENIENILCLVSYIPIMHKVYDKKTTKMETVQAGCIKTVQRIDRAFADKVTKP